MAHKIDDRLWYLAPNCRDLVAVVVEAVGGAALYIRREDRKPLATVMNARPAKTPVIAVYHGDYWRLTVRP